jgi:hypothetical protein
MSFHRLDGGVGYPAGILHCALDVRGADVLTTEDSSMESKAKLFGHPIHPMLIVFPLGLLVMALVLSTCPRTILPLPRLRTTTSRRASSAA